MKTKRSIVQISIAVFIHCFNIFFFFLLSDSVMAQQLNGVVMSAEKEKIQFSTVVLYNADSTMVKGTVTGADGMFAFSGFGAGTFWIEASYVGLPSFKTELFTINEGDQLDLGELQFEGQSVELAQVEVVSARPLIEVKPDKMVFNVDGSINATGNTALELLRKSPGVIVDNNENIILSGKSGVQVYLDGKPSYLSAEDLAQRLKTIQSSEIDKIEVITDPSARYDAEGNAGIINIVFKKDKSLGTNGSLNLGYAYGENHRYNTGVQLNHRNKKLNAFGNYDYRNGKSSNWFHFDRYQSGNSFAIRTISTHKGPSHSGRAGLDYFLTKSSTLGAMVQFNTSRGNRSTNSTTSIGDIETGAPLSILFSDSFDDSKRDNLSANLNYVHEGASGSRFSADLDYAHFANSTDNIQPNFYTDPDGETVNIVRNNESNDSTIINIFSAKADYEREAFDGKLSFGVKSSYVETDNGYGFYLDEETGPVLDVDRSSSFEFKELISAGYLMYQKKLNQWNFNAGLRLEHTSSEGGLTAFKPSNNNTVDLNYLDYFPSVGISYSINRKHQMSFNYNKRIKRPSYQDLNPFEYKLSELSFRKGNPFLNPQYAHNIALKHTYNYTLNTSLTYTRINDYFTYLSDTLGTDKSFLQAVNLDHQDVISLTVSYPYSPKNWWNTFTNLSGFYLHNVGDFGPGRLVDVDATVFSVYHQSTFLLPKGFSFEISGWLSSPGIWGAFFETETNWSIDTGLKKNFLDGRASLKIAFTDVFNTASWEASQSFAGFSSNGSGGWESRQLRLNLQYNFGSKTVKASRKRNVGLDDELKRVKSEGQ